MKILNILVVAIIITLCAGTSAAQMERRDFEKSPDFAKLDLRAQQAWRTAIEDGDRNAKFSCMLKVAGRLTPDQKNKLGMAGFKPGTIIQTIVTGRVAMQDLPKVAALDFVRVIELAMPLNLKADPGYKKYGTPKIRTKAKAKTKVKPKLITDKEKAPATKPAGKKEKTKLTEPKVTEKTPSDGSNVPIYETPPAVEPMNPNRPLTSEEIQVKQPAIAPPDQAPAIIQPKRTITQPFVEPVQAKPELQ